MTSPCANFVVREYKITLMRTDPSFTPAKPTRFEDWPLGELIDGIREIEGMLADAPLLPADLKCQIHIAKLVAETMPSAEVPSKESLSFLEKFDQHIETRKSKMLGFIRELDSLTTSQLPGY
ncbi:hypothetical protein D6D13_05996 [Aureobasidium pullulans]|uniref:Uncharacterized protein n=1 Tax=Aureobasidium pullulans TaxID=5580 RepID=A0A4V4J0L4_AURPU|nr:hypothetical protein D6D13_05996 [Aureobasidium pullulans]